MGDDATWELATDALRKALEHRGLEYVINEGDGAFYGPKIDFHLKDSIGRTWQCGTIQLDMLLPEKFDLNYIGEDGEKHRPIMVHRVVYGSIERFIGILIENYAGAFPVWLAPVQIKLLPVTDNHFDYAKKLADKFFELNIRAEVDARNEKISKKIRDSQVMKIPYTIVIGDKEIETGILPIRKYSAKENLSMSVDDFIKYVQDKISTHSQEF